MLYYYIVVTKAIKVLQATAWLSSLKNLQSSKPVSTRRLQLATEERHSWAAASSRLQTWELYFWC